MVRHQDVGEAPAFLGEGRIDRAASGASIAAVVPVEGSCSRTP
jgi:hypothetical protein